MHATVATHATLTILAALCVIFQAFPALCLFNPRRPRGEMQAVPCVARSGTRLLPASTSQSPPVDIRFFRKYTAVIYLYAEVETVLIIFTLLVIPREKETPAHPHPDAFARASTGTRPRGGTAPFYPCLHPCQRTNGEIRVKLRSGLNRAWRQGKRMILIRLRYLNQQKYP